MDRVTLRRVWRKRLDDLARSGLSVRAWCERSGVSRYQARYWKAYFADHEDDPSDPSAPGEAWLPVAIADPAPRETASARIVLRIGAAAIDIQPGFDPELLRRVVQALEPQGC